MHVAKVRVLLELYSARLYGRGCVPKPLSKRSRHNPNPKSELNYVLLMCRAAIRKLAKGECDRPVRMLAFIQGVLWSRGIMTTRDLNEDNRTWRSNKLPGPFEVWCLGNHMRTVVRVDHVEWKQPAILVHSHGQSNLDHVMRYGFPMVEANSDGSAKCCICAHCFETIEIGDEYFIEGRVGNFHKRCLGSTTGTSPNSTNPCCEVPLGRHVDWLTRLQHQAFHGSDVEALLDQLYEAYPAVRGRIKKLEVQEDQPKVLDIWRIKPDGVEFQILRFELGRDGEILVFCSDGYRGLDYIMKEGICVRKARSSV